MTSAPDLEARLAAYGRQLDAAADAAEAAVAQRSTGGPATASGRAGAMAIDSARRPRRALALGLAAVALVVALGVVGLVLRPRSQTLVTGPGPSPAVDGATADDTTVDGGVAAPSDLRIVFNCIDESTGAFLETPCFIDADGSDFRAVPLPVVPTSGPVPSPDRERLVVIVPIVPGTDPEFHLLAADGSELAVIPAPGLAYQPAWTPDGGALVYTADSALQVITVPGGGAGPGDGGAVPTESYELPWAGSGPPAVSPDGTRLAVAGGVGNGVGPGGVAVVDRATGVVDQIEAGSGISEVAWSPDGRRLAFSSQADDGRWAVQVLDTTSLEVTEVAAVDQPDGALFGPSWSPDGETLAYTGAELHLVEVADGATRTVDLGGRVPASLPPSWSPDGRWLTVGALDPGSGRSDLVLVDTTTLASSVVTAGRTDIGTGAAYPAFW